ncbi:hypothetical protein [Dendronalium sp. ChiSLP03b]|uniref:hypothetical protein n=1 Tax=Dendronalium sp. ChiSLP03b TaxID=3075381 RepID=UPI002AD1D02E|nr:hypothetical protein [Dendronalium sp. ChiSLP03b]MDZ8204664.1 hypothetical protein [Dendronalium sp. ChiSLP03b]
MCKTEIGRGVTPQSNFASRMFTNKVIRLTVPILTVAGWLAAIAPVLAITASYSNDYRVCAGRILREEEGVTQQSVSQACAQALRPRELADCVVNIKKNTKIVAADALAYCSEARRPRDYGICVVGISNNTEEAFNPATLDYCRRSLLPVRFAQCVVGLRSEIKDLPPTQALDTCIDGSDRIGGLPASSTLLPTQRSTEFSPTFETSPIPANPGSNY